MRRGERDDRDDDEGGLITSPPNADGRDRIRTFNKKVGPFVSNWISKEETEPDVELRLFQHDTVRYVRGLYPSN